MALAVFGRRVEGVFDWKIQAQAVLLQSLGVSGSTVRLVAQPIRSDHRRPLCCPFARAAHSAHSLRQTKTLYEGTAVRELPPSSVGPWNHTLYLFKGGCFISVWGRSSVRSWRNS